MSEPEVSEPEVIEPKKMPEEDSQKKTVDSTGESGNDLSQALVENMKMLTRHLQGAVVNGMALFSLVRHAARRDEAPKEPEASSPQRRRHRRHDVEP